MAHLMGNFYNHATGETINRELTSDEVAQFNAGATIAEKNQAEKQALRDSKIAIYTRLGMTLQEIEIFMPTEKKRQALGL